MCGSTPTPATKLKGTNEMIWTPESIVDVTKPPLGPPMRLANSFHMLIGVNQKNTDMYQAYIEEYCFKLKKYRIGNVGL